MVVDEEEEPASASASLVVHRFLCGGTLRPIDGNAVEEEDLKAFPKNKLSFDAISFSPTQTPDSRISVVYGFVDQTIEQHNPWVSWA